MSKTERPGVYTSYEISGSLYGAETGAAVGLAACGLGSNPGEIITMTSSIEATEAFGGGNIVRLASLLLKNGAAKLYAIEVEDGDYNAAFHALMSCSDIRFVVCDSHDDQVHKQLKECILSGDEQAKYRMGIIESDAVTRAELVEKAKQLNCERMVLVSHHQSDCPGAVAAAVCGAAAAGEDPALPLNGAELLGLGNIGGNFSDGDITLLILGGVTPIETVYGSRCIIRGISTRTTTGAVADPTWREINTVMIIDHMLPAMRDGLRRRFARAKNTAQTRGAIRTQVLVDLEEYQRREIIDSYGDISVSQSPEDPTVCLVNFAFTVAHGLNKIELRAHITV